MIKFLFASVCVIAAICWILYEMRHAPLMPANYKEDLDDFCPRHVCGSEIKKGEKFIAHTRNGSNEAFIIKDISGDQVYIQDQNGTVEMVDLLWLQKQISIGRIENDIKKTLSDHDAMYLRDQLNEIHKNHNISQY